MTRNDFLVSCNHVLSAATLWLESVYYGIHAHVQEDQMISAHSVRLPPATSSLSSPPTAAIVDLVGHVPVAAVDGEHHPRPQAAPGAGQQQQRGRGRRGRR